MSYHVLFTFSELPVLQADVMQRHARARYRKRWHKRVAETVMVMQARPPVPLESARLVGVRYSSATQHPDRPNVWYSFKPVVDGFVAAGVIADDRPSVLVEEDYRWERCKRGDGHITVEITGCF